MEQAEILDRRKRKNICWQQNGGGDANDIRDITTESVVTEKVVMGEERRTNRGFHGL